MDRSSGRIGRAAATLAVALTVAGVALATGCGGGDAAREAPPELAPSQKLRMARSMMGAGRVGEALALVDEAIAGEPGNASFHYYKGQLCFQSARHAEAEASFKRTLDLDPYLTDAWIYLGAVYQELGRQGPAESAYRSALDNPAYPSPEKAYHGLGVLYAAQGRDREATDAFRRAVEINPRFYPAHFELASVLERAGELVEAVREYEVAAPGFRNQCEYHFRLGLAYFRVERREDARAELSRVIEICPGSENAARADDLLEAVDG